MDRAVKAARRAYDRVWGRMPGAERAKYIYRIARMIAERSRELAVLESLDNGKPIKESRDVDVPTASAHFFYHAGWADKLGYAGLGPDPRPLGVAGQVIPWNFPLLMAAWKIAPALACGNTVVLKPAETTPLTALVLAEIIQQADLPPGVVNILPGAGDVGAELTNHAGVDKVAFTGSTDVGKLIQRSLAGSGKKLTLELGGKAANVVFDDAPLDQAVEGIVNGIFFNQGHVCCAGSRLLVQESVADELLEKLHARVSTLRIGDPLDKNTDVGAINSREQLNKINELVVLGRGGGRAPGGRARARCRTRVSSSRRPCSRVSARPCGSPARRSSARCCRCSPSARRTRPWRRRTTRRTACPRASGPTRGRGSSGWRTSCAPAWCGPTRSTGSTRPRRSAATRSPASAARVAARDWRHTSMSERLSVAKTYKLYVGGAFPRSESGRSYPVRDAKGGFLANAAQASRKDVREAVVAARKAFGGWSGATAYNRGQVLYRVAELLEGRREQFIAEVAASEGVPAKRAQSVVDAAIDRWVWYAGWTDKIATVLGAAEPGRRPVLLVLGARSRRAWWACSRRSRRRCWAW